MTSSSKKHTRVRSQFPLLLHDDNQHKNSNMFSEISVIFSIKSFLKEKYSLLFRCRK